MTYEKYTIYPHIDAKIQQVNENGVKAVQVIDRTSGMVIQHLEPSMEWGNDWTWLISRCGRYICIFRIDDYNDLIDDNMV